MTNWLIVVIALISFYLGESFGWTRAHKKIASECKKLGGFYVNDDVFHCIKISESEEKRMRDQRLKNTHGFWRDHGNGGIPLHKDN